MKIAFALALALASCRKPAAKEDAAVTTKTARAALPPIDLERPATIETATFATG